MTSMRIMTLKFDKRQSYKSSANEHVDNIYTYCQSELLEYIFIELSQKIKHICVIELGARQT